MQKCVAIREGRGSRATYTTHTQFFKSLYIEEKGVGIRKLFALTFE